MGPFYPPLGWVEEEEELSLSEFNNVSQFLFFSVRRLWRERVTDGGVQNTPSASLFLVAEVLRSTSSGFWGTSWVGEPASNQKPPETRKCLGLLLRCL